MSTFLPLPTNHPSKGKHFGPLSPSNSSMTPGKSIARFHMRELVEFLGRAAAGDESNCPSELDPLWHRWLAFPNAYRAFCVRRFGTVVEHVIDEAGKCYGHIPVQSSAGIDGQAPCRGRVLVQSIA